MLRRHFGAKLLAGVTIFTLAGAACSSDGNGGSSAAGGECTPAEQPVLTFAAYSTPREVYGKIISSFQEKWKEEHNDQSIIFQESYGGHDAGRRGDCFEPTSSPSRWADSTHRRRGPHHGDIGAGDGGWFRPRSLPGLRPNTRRHRILRHRASGVDVLTPPASRGGLVEHRRRLRRGDARVLGRAEGRRGSRGSCSMVSSATSSVVRSPATLSKLREGNATRDHVRDESRRPRTRLPARPSTHGDDPDQNPWRDRRERDKLRREVPTRSWIPHSDEAKEYYRTVWFLRSTDEKTAAKGDSSFGSRRSRTCHRRRRAAGTR